MLKQRRWCIRCRAFIESEPVLRADNCRGFCSRCQLGYPIDRIIPKVPCPKPRTWAEYDQCEEYRAGPVQAQPTPLTSNPDP